MSRKLKHPIQLPIYCASKRFLEFDEWCGLFADEIDIELAESGADREMDFNVESEYKKRYEMYLNESQPFCPTDVSGSVFLNKYNLKKGDKYRTKSFLGDIVITDIFESYFKVKVKHVSKVNYCASCTFTDFNNAMKSGEIVSLVRS